MASQIQAKCIVKRSPTLSSVSHRYPSIINLRCEFTSKKIFEMSSIEAGVDKHESTVRRKLHAVCFPGPFQSHIGAMLKLAKLLHHRGFFITFVNTDFNQQRLVRARGAKLMEGVSDFQFLSIADGLPLSNVDATQDIHSLCLACTELMVVPFFDLISNLVTTSSSSGSSVPPVSCVIGDAIASCCTAPAADKFGIPLIHLWTIAVCAILGQLKQLRLLMDKGFTPIQDNSCVTKDYLETPIELDIPGMKTVKLRDMLCLLRTTYPNDRMLKFNLDVLEQCAHKGTANIIHTFDALESDDLRALPSIIPRPCAVGPFHLMLRQIPEEEIGKLTALKGLDSNLWKEHSECLQWLDTKPPASIIYVNFGSVNVVTQQQLVEFAMGLAKCGHNFLWVVRPDLVSGNDGAVSVLPREFLEETKERGFISGWCPQEKVLSHPAVGGFLTHCGWNSIMEGLSAGIPMLCWPGFGDQVTNCKYVCDEEEWGVGLEISREVDRGEVERLVRELMGGDGKGERLRKRASEWRRLAEEAVEPLGSSCLNLEKLVREVCLT